MWQDVTHPQCACDPLLCRCAQSVPLIIAVCCVHRFIFPASSQTQESVVGFARTCEVAQNRICVHWKLYSIFRKGTENCIPIYIFWKEAILELFTLFQLWSIFHTKWKECIFMMIHDAIIIEEKLSFQLYFAKRIDQYLIHLIIQRNELSAPVWSSSSSSRWCFKSSWLEQPSAGQDQEPHDDFWQ